MSDVTFVLSRKYCVQATQTHLILLVPFIYARHKRATFYSFLSSTHRTRVDYLA